MVDTAPIAASNILLISHHARPRSGDGTAKGAAGNVDTLSTCGRERKRERERNGKERGDVCRRFL